MKKGRREQTLEEALDRHYRIRKNLVRDGVTYYALAIPRSLGEEFVGRDLRFVLRPEGVLLQWVKSDEEE